MIQQPVLPVITPDNRILGTIRIVPTVFVGNETTVSTNGVVFVIQKHRFSRADGVTVEFMVIPITFTEERQMAYQHLKGFVPINEVFFNNSWIQVANITQSPDRSRSRVEEFLQQKDFNAS